MEIWKDIEGYDGLYQVSNMGRVKSLKFGKEKILKSAKNNMGYLLIVLCKEGKPKTFMVHRLVAQAFIPNPDNLLEINHIDEDKTNNRVENIEYCDRSYNLNYGTRNNKVSKANSIPVLQFTKNGEFIKKWDSMIEAEKELGINPGNISKCSKGKIKTAYGFVWLYAVINGFSIDINKLKRVA